MTDKTQLETKLKATDAFCVSALCLCLWGECLDRFNAGIQPRDGGGNHKIDDVVEGSNLCGGAGAILWIGIM